MAKGNSLVPLIILFIVVGVGGFIGYSIYAWSNELADRGKKKMEKKNMSFTKDGGLRVGLKEQGDERMADKTQNVLVNVWNNAELPNYKSRLGWNSTQQQQKGKSSGTSSPRPGNSRANTNTSSATAIPPASPSEHRPGTKRTPSTPGAW